MKKRLKKNTWTNVQTGTGSQLSRPPHPTPPPNPQPSTRLSEQWWSNTYSLCHTSGNQLGGNCSIWPLSSLRRIPSLLRPCFLHTDEPEHSFYASCNPPPSLKTEKRRLLWCTGTHPKQLKTNRKRMEGELNKSRKRGRWIKTRNSLFRRVWDVSFHMYCSWEVGQTWPFLPGMILPSHSLSRPILISVNMQLKKAALAEYLQTELWGQLLLLLKRKCIFPLKRGWLWQVWAVPPVEYPWVGGGVKGVTGVNISRQLDIPLTTC